MARSPVDVGIVHQLEKQQQSLKQQQEERDRMLETVDRLNEDQQEVRQKQLVAFESKSVDPITWSHADARFSFCQLRI